MSCKYKNIAKCDNCSHVYYRECSTFVKVHTAYLVRALLPFKMTSQSFRGSVVWSSDINKAKSAASQYAMRAGSEVQKLTVSQVLSLILDGSDITGSVFYIEASSKVLGDPEKVLSVLISFIEKVLSQSGSVSLFLSPSSRLILSDYPRL